MFEILKLSLLILRVQALKKTTKLTPETSLLTPAKSRDDDDNDDNDNTIWPPQNLIAAV